MELNPENCNLVSEFIHQMYPDMEEGFGNGVTYIGPCHEVRIQNIYIETPHHVVVNFFNNTIQAEK